MAAKTNIMINMKKTTYTQISIFFPAYNEEANAKETVLKTKEVLEPLFSDFEIIVVDDGSSDRTGEIADELTKKDRRIKVIHHPQNLGYGAALISGFRGASKDLIFFTDCDLQFDVSEIKKLLSYIPEYDVVIGYRSPRRDPFMRLVNAWGWKWLNRILFGLKVRDIDCAFKLFKKEAIKSIQIKSRGAMISAEILIRLFQKGYKIKEVPVTHLPRKAGSPTGAKPKVILRAFYELIKIYPEIVSRTQREFIKYCLVGVLNTLLDWTFYLSLTRFFDFWQANYLFAKAVSFSVGVVNSFIWNRIWTFRSRERKILIQFPKFSITQGIALGLNVGIMYLFVSLLYFPDIIGLVMATLASLIFGFSLSKFWVFKEKND